MSFTAADWDKILQQQRTAHGLPPLQPMRPASEGRVSMRSSLFSSRSLSTWALGLCFLAGLLIGTLLVSRSGPDTRAALQVILGGYVERRQTLAFASIAASTFCSTFAALAVLFFCGFCTIAQIIIFAVPLFKGLGYGFSIGMLYAQYGTSAVRYVAFLLLPTMFLSTLLLILASRSSLRLSVTLLRSALVAPDENGSRRIKRYCVKYMIFIGICLLIALFDALLVTRFGGLFVL